MTKFSNQSKRMVAVTFVLAMLTAQFADVSLFDIAHINHVAVQDQQAVGTPDTSAPNDIGHPANHPSQHCSIAAATVEFGQNPSPESTFLSAEILPNGRNAAPSIPPPLV